MSTLRETVTRVAAEMRAAAEWWPVGEHALRGWAIELDAAAKADTEAVCEWTDDGDGCYKPGCLAKMSLTSWRKDWFKGQGWQGCPYCTKKVRWTP
jgi:hypothetical protein